MKKTLHRWARLSTALVFLALTACAPESTDTTADTLYGVPDSSERFEIQKEDYERAPEDVRVRLHVTPRARVVTRIRHEFETDFLLRTLFDHSTVAELAAVLVDEIAGKPGFDQSGKRGRQQAPAGYDAPQ